VLVRGYGDIMNMKTDHEEAEEQDRALAGAKLVDALVNTPKEKMSSMTVLTKVQAYSCTMLEVYEKVAEHLKNVIVTKEDVELPKEDPISEVFRHSLYKHNLSINGKLSDSIKELALEQIGMESEEDEDTPYDQR